ncbi:hypothetical protein D9C73_025326 [Collichthys lucidus]|uniref:Uncharacterized protein n=1 Tax=Collichthys lucidus TaxID=240159 RepID=A0A4V6AUT7_COLLU|nr:hypothetical protein D9C73_025326 [Collichthys lucidus]
MAKVTSGPGEVEAAGAALGWTEATSGRMGKRLEPTEVVDTDQPRPSYGRLAPLQSRKAGSRCWLSLAWSCEPEHLAHICCRPLDQLVVSGWLSAVLRHPGQMQQPWWWPRSPRLAPSHKRGRSFNMDGPPGEQVKNPRPPETWVKEVMVMVQ